MTFGGEPDTVAAFAEIVLVRVDDTEFVAIFRQIIEGGAAPFASDFMDFVSLFDLRKYLLARQTFQTLFGVDILHIFDIADRHPPGFGILHDIDDLVLVDPFEGHHIDLDLQSDIQSLFNACKDFPQHIFLGDLFGHFRFERIDRDIDSFEPCFFEPFGDIGKQITVGSQSEIDIGLVIMNHLNETVEILAEQRFTPGDADFVDTFVDRDTYETEQLFETEQIFPRHP